ncbi:MBL fold metallo-hydrolase [Pontibacillus marinus]|uniref:Metallo-beta-lactamase n=1 Tax=Pontibacillus marinus BH030004 = DSM 16465 TaxID=1385511 RepID=A0A0A5G4Z0_9BACI|nr:MBL fold metallo-hydrolase [Pontibacillus marinus]KGX87104.1 metallo-beta-lactamase [Pontibacillus marinus BH030004 = DSM 16465]
MIQYKTNNITVFQSTLYKTSSAIIETKHSMVMTDPNWLPEEVESIRQYVMKHIGDRELYIIYTHSDFDHIIGAGAFPEAKVIASEEFNENPHKEEIIKQNYDFDQKYYLQRSYLHTYPTVDIGISEDGQTLELEDITLSFFKAPGHTNDSLFTVVEPFGIFLSGDYLSDVEFPFIFSSYKDYVDTIEKAANVYQNYDITIQVPGHGYTTDNQQEMRDRLVFSQYYLQNLLTKKQALVDELSKKYTFFEGMKDIHDSNVELANQELES